MGILNNSIFFEVGRVLLLTLLFSYSAEAGLKDALARKFPKCHFVEKSKFLTEKEYKMIKSKFPTRDVRKFYSFYQRVCNQKSSFDFVFSDIVRTKRQLVHIHIEDKKLESLKVVKFEEPSEYRVKDSWLKKFKSTLPDSIDIVSGATLSSKSTKFLVWLSLYLQGDILK